MEETIVKTENPLDKGKMVNGRPVKYKINNVEPMVCELENGDILTLIPVVSSIVMPLDDKNNPIVDPVKHEPFYNFNINITASVMKGKSGKDASR